MGSDGWVQAVVAPVYQIDDLIRKHYGSDLGSLDAVLAELGGGIEFGKDGELDLKELESEANSAPIIRYVDLVLAQAIQDRASDIHFEPFETDFKIRYRVDGSLYEMAPPPRHLANPVISRIKVMSNMNIAERRIPQDGRIQKIISGRQCQPNATHEACVIVAHDAKTGKELWRARTIPRPGEPGNETWGDVPLEQRWHVGTWMVPSYDPQTNLIIVGTSVTIPAHKFQLAGKDKEHLYHN